MTVPAPPADRLPDGFVVRIAPGTQRREGGRSEEHTSELQSRHNISYAVFCLDRKSVV